MGFAVAMALCLCGQTVYSSEDTLDQWENRLLESKWVYTDPTSGAPRIVLVMKCFSPDHRIFQLTLYNEGIDDTLPYIQTWTGTYKMESRKATRNDTDSQDSVKLARIRADQYWVPVNANHCRWPGRYIPAWSGSDGQQFCSMRQMLQARGLIHWTEDINYIDWSERIDFKPFYAELVFDAPFMWTEPLANPENVKLFLRSDAITHIGWWKIGCQYILSPVKKQ